MKRFILASLFIATTPLAAQSPPERAFLDSITTARLDSRESCATAPGAVERLCSGLTLLNRVSATGAVTDASRAIGLFERAVADNATWPRAWFGLGLARIQAARSGLIAHEGALQPSGLSLEAGAGYALVRALELEPGYPPAAEALALISIPREGASRLQERVAMLRHVRPLLSGLGDYSAAQVELVGGDPDSATSFLEAALLHSDIDSGVVLLSLARARYRANRPVEGRAMLLRGARDTAAASQAAYRAELVWTATAEELSEWDSLPPPARSDWLAGYWGTRDVTDGRGEGERLIEHYRRMEFALHHYRMELPRRGAQRSSSSLNAVDHLDLYSAGTVDFKDLYGTTSMLRQFRSSSSVFDDRGVVYIRQGPPDRVARTVGGQAFEGWSYERDGGPPLVLYFKEEDFDGQVGATALTPQVLTAFPLERAQLCQLDPGTCPFAADPRATTLATYGGRLPSAQAKMLANAARTTSPSSIAAAVNKGRASIDTATTTDRFARKFSQAITPTIQMLSVRKTTSDSPYILLVFAIPGDQALSVPLGEAGGRTGYSFRLVASVARHGDGKRFSVDTIRNFATQQPLTAGEYLIGSLELRVEPGDYTSSLAITQEDGRGAVASLGRVVAAASRNKLAVSDVILGAPGGALKWNSGRELVALNPLNAFRSGGTAALYAQFSGMKPSLEYQATLEVFLADDPKEKRPQLSISFVQPAKSGLIEIQRDVALKNLKPGRYRVRLAISGGGEQAFGSTILTIVK